MSNNDKKNNDLEKIKKYVEMTSWRGVVKAGLDWLMKNDINTLQDLFSKKIINLIDNKVKEITQAVLLKEKTQADLINDIELIADAQILTLLKKDNTYDKETVEEMKKQQVFLWGLIHNEELFIFEEEKDSECPSIWWNAPSDEVGVYAKDYNITVNQKYTLDFTNIEDKNLRKEMKNCYFVEVKLGYYEFYSLIEKYLIHLPKNTNIVKSELLPEKLISKITKKDNY